MARTVCCVDGSRQLQLCWKDPLVVLYLYPVPSELNLHFGVSIEFTEDVRDPLVTGMWSLQHELRVHMWLFEGALVKEQI